MQKRILFFLFFLSAGTFFNPVVGLSTGEMQSGTISGTTQTGVKCEKDVEFVGVGSTKVLKAHALPGDVLTWSSSNKAIATIDPLTGVVRGLSKGEVTITVTNKEQHTATCTVRVYYKNNLLLNGGFETVLDPAVDWIYIPLEWFVSYYDKPGAKSQYNNNEIKRNTGDHTNPERALFYFGDIVQGDATLRFNENRLGGVYQTVRVKPGREYVYRADIGFTQNDDRETMLMESVKILSADGKTLYSEALIPSFEYQLFDRKAHPNHTPTTTYAIKGAAVEVVGTFTVPKGVKKVRFQLDQRTRVISNTSQTPRTYIDNCELNEL